MSGVSRLPVARAYFVVLALLLAGYMLSGRGFAHIAIGPVYVGDVVLVLGLAVAGWVTVRTRGWQRPGPQLGLVLALMALGLVDTLPYLSTYGRDALRDATLWGYGLFAIVVYLLADRALVVSAARAYGRFLPVFALWLPLCWELFRMASAGIDPNRPGDYVPLVFFKAGDMAVHTAGAITFLAVVAMPAGNLLNVLWRGVIALPLLWTVYATAAVNRGSMLTSLAGIVGSVMLAPRSRMWRSVGVGLVLLLIVIVPKDFGTIATCGSGSAPAVEGRDVSPCQVLENAISVTTTTGDSGLDGTRNFRLAWWSAIVDYTVRGPYFWTGKGFGINLADADGFQPTADHSLRAPHNSHLTALARMGVPGFALWVALQAAFGIGLLRALLRFRRGGDRLLAAVAGWIGVYWGAMLVDTSFDPYLEGPQGGIWFWVLVGLGMAVMRMAAEPNGGLGRIGFPLDLPSLRRPTAPEVAHG